MSACDFGAGWCGGVAGISMGHPMDTIKVRVQATKELTAREAVKKCMKAEGFRGFFKGLSYPLMAAGAVNSVFFGAYASSLAVIAPGKNDEQHSKKDVFLAGCIGGIAQVVVACPVDIVKIKLQMQQAKVTPGTNHKRYMNPIAVLGTIIKRQGIKGLYTGSLAMGQRDCIASGLYFSSYHYMTHDLKCSSFFAGGMAGVLSWVAVLPLDVVKSRLQADSIANPRYSGLRDCFVQTYREGGLKIFSRGLAIVSVRAFPVNGATFVAYEWYMNGCGSLW